MLIDNLQILEGAGTVNLSFPKGASFPTSPNVGEVFYRTDELKAYVYSGTAWAGLGGGSAGTPTTQVYDIGFTCPGEVPPATTLLFFVVGRDFTLPASLDNSVATVGLISEAVVFSLRKNGTEVGTISYSNTGVVTMAVTTDTYFNFQDVLSIESPAGAMPTNLGVTLAVVLS